MKRILYLFAFLCIAIGANAQHFTLWYGANYGTGVGNALEQSGHNFHFANFGLDYTSKIEGNLDWTVGLGYNTKGGESRVGYLQLEGNAGYNVVNDGQLKLAILTGPFAAVKTNENFTSEIIGNSPVENPYRKAVLGWQAGINLSYKSVSLKLGYECPFTNMYKKEVHTNFQPHEWFARIGVKF